MVKVGGNEVGQVVIFRVFPALLDRIQLWRVRRKPLEVKPIGMVLGEVGRRRSMHAVAIPNQDHSVPVMMMQLPQKPHEVVGLHVFPQQLEVMR